MHNIPDNNHVVRHCKKNWYDPTTNIVSIDVFKLRQNKIPQEKDLSCFWFEFWGGDISKIEEDLLRVRNVHKNDKNILISIEKMKDIIKDYKSAYTIQAIHCGGTQNSYSKIYPNPVTIFNEEKLQGRLLESIVKIYDIMKISNK